MAKARREALLRRVPAALWRARRSGAFLCLLSLRV